MKAWMIITLMLALLPLAAADTLQTYVWDENNATELTIIDGETAVSKLNENSWETYVYAEVWIFGNPEPHIIYQNAWSMLPFVDVQEFISFTPEIYGGPGTYNIKAIMLDNEKPTPYSEYDSIILNVKPKPIENRAPVAVIEITENPSLIGEEVFFDGRNSYDLDNNTLSYIWKIDGIIVSYESTFTKTFDEANNYEIKLKVYDGELRGYDYETLVIQKYEDFKVSFYLNPTMGEAPLVSDVKCQVLRLGGGEAANYDVDIDFGDGLTGNELNMFHIYVEEGKYSSVCTVTQKETGKQRSETKEVIVKEPINQAPKASLTASNYNPEIDEEVILNASGSKDSDGKIVKYEWQFNEDGYFELGGPVINNMRWDTSGKHFVKVKVTDDDGATDIASVYVYVKEIDYEDFGGMYKLTPKSGIAPLTVNVLCGAAPVFGTGADASYTKEWDFGDGSTGDHTTRTHTYDNAGEYTATCTVTQVETGKQVSKSYEVTVQDYENFYGVFKLSPTSGIAPLKVKTVCAALPEYGSGVDATYNVKWDFGDGTTYDHAVGEYTYTVSGDYSATCTVTQVETGEQRIRSWAVTVKEPVEENIIPIARIFAPERALTGQKVVFDASGSEDTDGKIIQYTWKLNDETIYNGSLNKLDWIFAETGDYELKLIVTDDDYATAEATKQIRVGEIIPLYPPVAVLIATEEGYVNELFRFDASRSYDTQGYITKYVWKINGTIIAEQPRENGDEFLHNFTEAGNYLVEVVVIDNDGLSDAASAEVLVKERIVVNERPNAILTGPTIGTVSVEYTFDGSASTDDKEIVEYVWYVDGDEVLRGLSNTLTWSFSQTKEYSIDLDVVDAEGLSDTDSLDIVINEEPHENEAPHAVISGPTSTEKGKEVTFDASASFDNDGSIVKYIWNIAGNVFESVESIVTWVFDTVGNYDVAVTVEDNEGAQDTATQQIEVWEKTLPPIEPEEPEEDEEEDTLKFTNIGIFGHNVNEVRAGDLLQVKISAQGVDTEGRPSLIVQELGIKSTGRFEEIDGREVMTAGLWIPKDVKPGEYMLRIGFKGDNSRKGEIRWFKVVE